MFVQTIAVFCVSEAFFSSFVSHLQPQFLFSLMMLETAITAYYTVSGEFRGGASRLWPPFGRRTEAVTRGHVS